MPNLVTNKNQLKSDRSRMMGKKVATKDQFGSAHNQDNREPKHPKRLGPPRQDPLAREEKQDIRKPKGVNVKTRAGELPKKAPGLRGRRSKHGNPKTNAKSGGFGA